MSGQNLKNWFAAPPVRRKIGPFEIDFRGRAGGYVPPEADVYLVDGIQGHSLSTTQARELAAALVEAADFVDREKSRERGAIT
jgi:hypothetical protein